MVFIIVGIAPKKSAIILLYKPRSGLSVTCQRTMPAAAQHKQIMLDFSQPPIPYLKLIRKTINDWKNEAPEIQRATVFPAAYSDHVDKAVMIRYMILVVLCGFAFPRIIERMYTKGEISGNMVLRARNSIFIFDNNSTIGIRYKHDVRSNRHDKPLTWKIGTRAC